MDLNSSVVFSFPSSITRFVISSGPTALSPKFITLVYISTIKCRLVASNYLADISPWMSMGYFTSMTSKSEFQSFLSKLFSVFPTSVISNFTFRVTQAKTPEPPCLCYFYLTPQPICQQIQLVLQPKYCSSSNLLPPPLLTP